MPTSRLASLLPLWPWGTRACGGIGTKFVCSLVEPLGHWHCFLLPKHNKSFAEAQGASTKCFSPAFWRLFIFGSRQSCGGQGKTMSESVAAMWGDGPVRCKRCSRCRIMGFGMGWGPPSIKWAGRTRGARDLSCCGSC